MFWLSSKVTTCFTTDGLRNCKDISPHKRPVSSAHAIPYATSPRLKSLVSMLYWYSQSSNCLPLVKAGHSGIDTWGCWASKAASRAASASSRGKMYFLHPAFTREVNLATRAFSFWITELFISSSHLIFTFTREVAWLPGTSRYPGLSVSNSSLPYIYNINYYFSLVKYFWKVFLLSGM